MAAVFELEATLGLNTANFDGDLNQAVNDVKALEQQADSLNTPPVSTGGSILTPVKDDAKTLDSQLEGIKTTAAETSGFVEGIVRATEVVVEAAIEGIIEFGKQSIAAAASTGSELANAFNESKAGFEVGLDSFKVAAGEKILPIADWFYELGDSLMGISYEEKLRTLAVELENISKINFEKTLENVGNVFGIFDQVGSLKVGNVDDYTKGVQEQTAYWEKYAATLDSLREKGIGEDVLGQLADGSKSSMEQLLALDQADPSKLETLAASYSKLQEAQQQAATSMSELTLPLTEEAQSIADLIATLAGDQTDYGVSGTAAGLITKGIITELQTDYPAISSLISQINDELASLGLGENVFNLSKPEEGESGEALTAELDIVVSDNSESDMQSTIDSMTLDGKALIKADPNTGPSLQGYLDGLKLSAYVTLKPKNKLGGDGGSDETPGHAVGLDYVPYDDYAARLHEGEAVLTKLEADRWRRKEGEVPREGNVNVTQYITVTANEDFDEAVYRALEKLRWNS